MNKRILFFGDSNTYGFDPRNPWGGRLEPSLIWVNRLAEDFPNWEMINAGQNGREIPHTAFQIEGMQTEIRQYLPLDMVAIMLGTNDIFYMPAPSVQKITRRMRDAIRAVRECIGEGEDRRILLIAPARIQLGGVFGREIEAVSMQLGSAFRKLAREEKVDFADAGQWDISLAFDGVHFSEEGHRQFYEQIRPIMAAL